MLLSWFAGRIIAKQRRRVLMGNAKNLLIGARFSHQGPQWQAVG